MNHLLVYFAYGSCATAVGVVAGVIVYGLLLEARDERRKRAADLRQQDINAWIDSQVRAQRSQHEQLMRETGVDHRRQQELN